MNRPLVRPRRLLRHELYSLASVLAIPIAFLVVFPTEAIAFRPSPDREAEPASCAFVTLSDDEIAQAVSDARAAWRVGTEGVRKLRVDLSVETMPEEPHSTVMSADEREPVPRATRLHYDAPPFPPTLAAPRPDRIAQERKSLDDALPFPRADLLKLD